MVVGPPDARQSGGTGAARAPWATALFAVLVPVAWVVGRSVAGPARAAFEGHLLYWCLPALAALWLHAAVCRFAAREPTTPADRRAAWLGRGLAILLAALVFVLSPPALRVQFDETSLAGVARAMHEQRAAVLPTAALPCDGAVLALEQTVDKRPPLFAGLVSLVHDLTGARVGNAFVVNGALLAVLFALVHGFVLRRLGGGLAIAAQWLVAAVPLVGVVATSGGFELLAAVLLLATIGAAAEFVERPDGVRLRWLCANALALCWTRYESALLAGIVLALAVAFVWRERGGAGLRGAARACRGTLAWAPGLLVPLAFLLQNAARADFHPEAGGRALFAASHLAAHAPGFAWALLGPAFASPWPGVLAWVGLAAFGWRLLRRRAGRLEGLVGAPVVAATAVALAWFYGDVQEPTAWRLWLPAALCGGLLPLLLARRAGGPLPTGLVLGIAMLAAGEKLTALGLGRVWPRLPIAAVTEALEEARRAVPGEPGRTLWIGCVAQHLIAHGAAAMPADAFLRHRAEVAQSLATGRATQILVVTTPLDEGFAPAFGDARALVGQAPLVWRSPGDGAVSVFRLR